MQLLTRSTDVDSRKKPHFGNYTVGFTRAREDVLEVQRLRYKVFTETFGSPHLINPDRLNVDEYDDYCDHLVVKDAHTLQVVGTCRLMNPQAAQLTGHYYSEKEFDLSPLGPIRAGLVEAGHACVHPDYRGGSVVKALWSGLAAYMQRERAVHLIGCVSVSLADGGRNATALYHAFTPAQTAPCEYRVTPHTPFPVHDVDPEHRAHMPPLLRSFSRSGAWVCGEPAWDRDFYSADFLMLLPLSRWGIRYSRHNL